MQESGNNVTCPHENRIRIDDLFASTLLFVTEITEKRLRRTSVYELLFKSNSGSVCWYVQLKEKTELSNNMSKCANMEFVWNMEDLFHSTHQIFHSILEPFHIPYRFFPSIPYHSMPCLAHNGSGVFGAIDFFWRPWAMWKLLEARLGLYELSGRPLVAKVRVL